MLSKNLERLIRLKEDDGDMKFHSGFTSQLSDI